MTNTLLNYLLHGLIKKMKGVTGVRCNKSYLIFLLGAFLLINWNTAIAQSRTISGTVSDGEMGGLLPGVTVLVKGTNQGTSSDFDGNFSLANVSADATLVFSYIGYKDMEVKVSGRTNFDVTLYPDLEALDEVVVIGYGTARKSDLTGSVVSIGGADLKEQPIANVAQALTGRLAGVQVASAEGSPDAEIKIRIRGGGSITQDSSPLIIVDGFPVNSISDVSSSDIANISVLKDASSTAIYGSRGANGVIIITTKSGSEGKITANFNSFYGYKTIANTIDVLNPEDYVKWQYEYALLKDPNNLDSYEKYFGLWQDFDQYSGQIGNNWQKQIYGRRGTVQSSDLSVRGGTEKSNFSLNYAQYDEKAIMVGSDFKRNNLTMSLKSNPNDKLNLSFTLRYSDTEINGGGANEQNEVSSADARLRHSVGYSPIPISGLTATDVDEVEVSGYLVNPFVAVDDNQRFQLRKNFNMVGGLSYNIIDNLTYKMDLGLDNRNLLDYRFYGRSTYYSNNRPAAENQGLPALITSDAKSVRFRNANTLDFDFKNLFDNNNHDLKLLVGEEIIISTNNEVTSEIQGFPKLFGFETARNLTSQGTPLLVDNFYSPDDKLLSLFGRLNYSYKDKYLLTATYRADGSSKFLGNNKWGYFPSAALAWKISEEEFLKESSWLDLLKVRASYGESGNNNIPAGQTIQNYQSTATSQMNTFLNFWQPSNTLANPDLKWETTITQNIGLDFGFFNGLLSGTVETYQNITQDLLIRFPIPGSGYVDQFRNLGEVENRGIEATLNISAINKEDFGLNISLNAGMNKNKINSLGDLEDFGQNTNWASSQIGNDFLVKVGEPLGVMYGFQSDGRYEVSDFDYDVSTQSYTLKSGVVENKWLGKAVPGSMKLKDLNGDGIVDINDQTIIGNSNPTATGGMVLSARAYGFDLSAAFNFSIGNDVYNANKIEFTTANQNNQYRNLSTDMADGVRWTNLDPTTGELVKDPTQLDALNANTTMWSPYMSRYVFSDWAVEDGSFLRLNNLTLGYRVPKTVLDPIGVSNLRFYATANNVFIITNYSGLDPEVSTRRKTPLTPGVDYSPYPRSRQLVFGLNLNF